MQINGIYEQRDAQSITYILEDSNLFFSMGYKVLKSQEGKGFVKCNHLTHNGKDKLVYDISKYKSMTLLATILDSVAFLSVFVNLLDSFINAKNNGFMQYNNIDTSFDNIFVDCNNYKVYIIYVPINIGMSSNDVLSLNERFRYCATEYLNNYFKIPDENITFIKNIVTSQQFSLEDMKNMICERVSIVNRSLKQMTNVNILGQNIMGMQSINNIPVVNQGINNMGSTNQLPGNIQGGAQGINNAQFNNQMMNNMQGVPQGINNMQQGNQLMSNMSGGVPQVINNMQQDGQRINNGFSSLDADNVRKSNNPMRGSSGSVSETMDISELLKQIRKYGIYDEIGENTAFEDTDRFEKRGNNRLNLGGTPGSMSKAGAQNINSLANSGVIPNVKNFRNMEQSNGSNRVDAANWKDMHNTNIGVSRLDGPMAKQASKPKPRNNGGLNRTINANIKLVSDMESGEIELIIDKEEFLIGKNFNVVDGFIPHNEGISRVHCKIIYSRGEYCIIDMGSLNGTYVNGAKIPVKSQVPISIGDKIGIANIEFTVETI